MFNEFKDAPLWFLCNNYILFLFKSNTYLEYTLKWNQKKTMLKKVSNKRLQFQLPGKLIN